MWQDWKGQFLTTSNYWACKEISRYWADRIFVSAMSRMSYPWPLTLWLKKLLLWEPVPTVSFSDSFDHKTNRGLKSKWTTLCIPVNIQSSFTYHGSYSHLIFCGVPKLVQNCMSVIGLSLRYCGKHLIYWLISRQVWQLTLWPQNW